MKQYQQVPAELQLKIDSLLKNAGEARRAGDIDTRERLALEAWAMLPYPKLNWDYYSNILPRDNLLFYRDTKQFTKAIEWLEISREAYGPGREETIEFIAATLWFAMDDLDKAWEEFDRQYKVGKTRPFQGKDKKYLDFYLSRKAKK